MVRLSLARRLNPLPLPAHVSMRADQLKTQPTISGSFAADLRFVQAPLREYNPTLAARVETSAPATLRSEVAPEFVVPIELPGLTAPIWPSVGDVSVVSRLALFLPSFRVEEKTTPTRRRMMPERVMASSRRRPAKLGHGVGQPPGFLLVNGTHYGRCCSRR